ncbi:hypothetical protein GOODEAATRI_005133 [Goodea atripinnis]|uniref:Uncharacterized protein n=1 Tax=Goodea atripinnis TaxID=208336 RepID=A0ABV0PBJ1_9TELE
MLHIIGPLGGAAGSSVSLQHEGPGFDSWPGSFCMFSPCMCRFHLGTLASPQSKNMTIRLCLSQLLLLVHDCFSVFPCNGLETCPGPTPPVTCRLLEIGTNSPVTLYRKWMVHISKFAHS